MLFVNAAFCVKSPSLFLPIRQASHTLKAPWGGGRGRGGRRGESAVTLICMHSRRPDDDLIFQITLSARSLGALMGPATTVHSAVTTFQTAGTAPMRQTAVREICAFAKVINFKVSSMCHGVVVLLPVLSFFLSSFSTALQ